MVNKNKLTGSKIPRTGAQPMKPAKQQAQTAQQVPQSTRPPAQGAQKVNPYAQAAMPKKKKSSKNKDNRRILAMASGICVAITIISLGVSGVQLSRATALQQQYAGNVRTVLVPTHDITSLSTISDTDLKEEEVPATYIPDDCVTDRQEIVGKQAIVYLSSGIPISASSVQGVIGSDDLAVSVANGYVAYMIQLDDAGAIAPLLKVGDHVNVYADVSNGASTSSVAIAENVRVLALDATLTGGSSTYSRVTVEVTNDQAKAIAGASQGCTLSLQPRTNDLTDTNTGSSTQAQSSTDTSTTSAGSVTASANAHSGETMATN